MSRSRLVAVVLFTLATAEPTFAGNCKRFTATRSTAYHPGAGKIVLPWRTDFPGQPPRNRYAWEAFNPKQWDHYLSAALGEIKEGELAIRSGRIVLSPEARWWITPWLDYGRSGREPLLGLTKERGPREGELAPGSSAHYQVWAISWYNAEGAYALGQVFDDPCNPKIPGPPGKPWTFPARTMSFKLLFTDADIGYLTGAPVVEAVIHAPDGMGRVRRLLRLLQVDVAVRDPRAQDTGWVMGTFVWQGPARRDGLFDNLVPVGLTWGNDPDKYHEIWDRLVEPRLDQTVLNPFLRSVSGWPARPFLGFQGRLNGPADNLRSSCLSCHALSQWPEHPVLKIRPSEDFAPSPTLGMPPKETIARIVGLYFRNVPGGQLVDPHDHAVPLDYSMQLKTAFERICAACSEGALTGPTPDICRKRVGRPSCPTPSPEIAAPAWRGFARPATPSRSSLHKFGPRQ